jgi:nicotinamidase-related amidase
MASLLGEFKSLLTQHGATESESAPELTKDDVVIVVDMQVDFLPGGTFGVAEGNEVVQPIVALIRDAAAVGARIFATRDYHPINHCSFASHGGPFPPHCVQNTHGSCFAEPIGAALAPLVQTGAAQIVFKGFSKDVDSFGGFPYEETQVGERVSASKSGTHCGSAWTGAFVLFSSTADGDINAPPDVMSVLDRVSLGDAIGKVFKGRIFVCGLALDFCVLDTAVNAAKQGYRTAIVIDLARSAHIPGVGKHGTGFLTDPNWMAQLLAANAVPLVGVPAVRPP